MGRKSDAIAELEVFQSLYPQVQGVEEQIARLKNTPVALPTEETVDSKKR